VIWCMWWGRPSDTVYAAGEEHSNAACVGTDARTWKGGGISVLLQLVVVVRHGPLLSIIGSSITVDCWLLVVRVRVCKC